MRYGTLIEGITDYERIIFPNRQVEVFGELHSCSGLHSLRKVLYLCKKHKYSKNGPSSAIRYQSVQDGLHNWVSYTGQTLSELQQNYGHYEYLWLDKQEIFIIPSNKFSKHVLERFDD